MASASPARLGEKEEGRGKKKEELIFNRRSLPSGQAQQPRGRALDAGGGLQGYLRLRECFWYFWHLPKVQEDRKIDHYFVPDALVAWNQILRRIYLPLAPNNDLFGKMTSKQRKVLAGRLQNLNEQLQQAEIASSLGRNIEATKILQRAFGAAFG